MKKLYFYATLALMLIFTTIIFSCNEEETMEVPTTSNSMEEVRTIAINYLFLEGNSYKFRLSEKEAIELGISTTQYQQYVMEIDHLNEEVAEALAHVDSTHQVILTDPQQIKSSIKRTKSMSEGGMNVQDLSGTKTIAATMGKTFHITVTVGEVDVYINNKVYSISEGEHSDIPIAKATTININGHNGAKGSYYLD